MLATYPNLSLLAGSVGDLIVEPSSSSLDDGAPASSSSSSSTPYLSIEEAYASAQRTSTASASTSASLERASENKVMSRVKGVVLETGERIAARSVVICTGTFLRGEIHIGMTVFSVF